MNARKLKSGRWQSKVYVGNESGKKIFVTVTEDSKTECLLKAARVKSEYSSSVKISVIEAVDRYINAKKGVLSPSTVAGYMAKKKNYIEGRRIASVRLDLLTAQKVQEWVSELSEKISKKSIANVYGLLSASVRMFFPKADLSVRFPQGKRYDGYVPSTEEVVILLQAARQYDERLFRACLLGAFGALRRGEISPLTREDIKGNIVSIDKDMVKDENGKWVTKLPKTEDSVRTVELPQWIIKEMPQSGKLVDYTPDEITKWFGKVVGKTGLPHFRFHDLRKHAVSLMASQGVSMASIKDFGGWSNMQTPQRIYIKALADAKKREMENYMTYLNGISAKL